MKSRIFRATVSVGLLMVLSTIIIIMGVLYAYFDKQFVNELSQEAVFVKSGVEKNGVEYLNSLGNTKNRITWIASDGTVIYDSIADEAAMDNHLDREEVKEALESSVGESIRYSSTISEKTVNYAVRLNDGSVLRISREQYTVWTILAGMFQPILVVIVAAFIISAVITYAVSKMIVKPLNEIDLEHPEEAVSYDEIAPLLRKLSLQNKQIAKNMEELRRQRESFNTITENMSEGFLIIDNLTKILSHNSSALKLLGISGDVENKSVLGLNRSESFCKAIDMALNGNHNVQKMDVDGKYYQIFANPVFQDKTVVGAVITILDVTEKEKREEFRREFTANVSHELNTPLTTISGTAEIIKSGLVKPEDIPHFASNIYNEAQRLITLVGDILKLSKMDENNITSEKKPVDMKDVIKRVLDTVRPMAVKKSISIEFQSEDCYVNGISPILEEIVFNILDNAVKYNKDNGSIKIVLENKDGHVELSVSDTGIGIPYEEQDRVFERFYRVDKSHSKDIGGTGLGLSIVKHGAAIHNATVTLKSAPLEGTTISVLF